MTDEGWICTECGLVFDDWDKMMFHAQDMRHKAKKLENTENVEPRVIRGPLNEA